MVIRRSRRFLTFRRHLRSPHRSVPATVWRTRADRDNPLDYLLPQLLADDVTMLAIRQRDPQTYTRTDQDLVHVRPSAVEVKSIVENPIASKRDRRGSTQLKIPDH
jgi:hypothetical protein